MSLSLECIFSPDRPVIHLEKKCWTDALKGSVKIMEY